MKLPKNNTRSLPIHPDPKAAEAFWEWFGNSRIKDARGRPKVMYHATGDDFDSFDTGRGDLGAHFGTLAQAEYATKRSQAPAIMPVYLKIESPLKLKDVGSFHADGIIMQLAAKGWLPRAEAKRIYDACDKDWRLRKEWDPAIRQMIIDRGFDGVVYNNTHEGEGFSYIVLHPSQIKSAIGNSGRFLMDSLSLTDQAVPDHALKVRIA